MLYITLIGLLVLLYLIYLHFELYKKNVYIKSIEAVIKEFKASLKNENIESFLQKLNSISPKEKLHHNKQLQSFIFDNEKDNDIYIHYTKEESIAKKIIHEGFKFENTLFKTTEKVSNDKIEFNYKHSLRRPYGDLIIVINISKRLTVYYSEAIKRQSVSLALEQVLTETPPCLNEDKKMIYILPSQFIKGYFNYETGEIVKNPIFNSEYDSDAFKRNLYSK